MISIKLLDKTVYALRDSVVDDVHLCLRIADLLESLTSSIRNKFVRLAPTSRNTSKRHPNATHHSHRPSKSQNDLHTYTTDSASRGKHLSHQQDRNDNPYSATTEYSDLSTPTLQGPYSNHHLTHSSKGYTHNQNPNNNNNGNDETHFLPQPDFIYTHHTNDPTSDDAHNIPISADEVHDVNDVNDSFMAAAYPYPTLGSGGPDDPLNQHLSMYPQTVSPDPFLYPETLSENAAAAASLRTWLRLVNAGGDGRGVGGGGGVGAGQGM